MSGRTHQSSPPRPGGGAVPPHGAVPRPGGFAALGVPAPLVAALARLGVEAPFPIQAAAVPDALAGRDVLGRAHTGSGKTVAFALPLVAGVAALDESTVARRPAGLILVPTRELAAQVSATVAPLAQAVGLRTATVHGGVSAAPQIAALRRGADIVVATPGRLEDLIAQRHCGLGAVRITVLDEADQLADMGFFPAVRRLLAQTPPETQRLLFSATLDGAVNVLARDYLRDPVTHSIHLPEEAPALLEHHLLCVRAEDRAAVVAELASGSGRSLLFARTKHGARKLALRLSAQGIHAAELHSNLTQRARERNLTAFAEGRVRVLVATDIAARGIHVDGVELVVHVDPPAEHKAYLHRSGRTARAGARGTVVTVASPEQVGDVKSLLRKAKVSFTTEEVGAADARTAALVEQATQGPDERATDARDGRAVVRHRPGRARSGASPRPAPAAKRRVGVSAEPSSRSRGAGAIGTVRWFNTARGYGFITPDGSAEDIFVHQSTVQLGGFKVLSEGQRVRFEAADGKRGRQATMVRTA